MATQAESSPALGTLIDNGSLELVELLGQGGYGIVYRAIDTRTFVPTSYAVKCLPHAHASRSSRRRQLHLREIRLHKLASAHSNVVSLHKVVEDKNFTYIIMDYCEDGDLFTQILHQRRYLGQDALVKHVFLQLLDAVEYCHSLGIYHRDLKPENVLCFDGGLHLAITDFGLATLDTVSEEFRTGSAYHMSPECHGGPFAPSGTYSPLFNDVWSLGIILLNLLTGRNPWKSASLSDPTFYAYLQDPARFIPTVLPISDEVNRLLVRTLEVDWRKRITLGEMKEIILGIDSFYSDDVVFEGSMARCAWEVGMDVGSSESYDSQEAEFVEPEAEPVPEPAKPAKNAVSWESKSDSGMVFASQSAADASLWRCSLSEDAACGTMASMRSSSLSATCVSSANTKAFQISEPALSDSTWSGPSRPASPSFPITPNDPAAQFSSKRLVVNTAGCTTGYYRNSVTMKSDRSGSMYTAMESEHSASSPSYLAGASTMLSKSSSYDDDSDEFEDMAEDAVEESFNAVDSADDDSSSSSSRSERADSPVVLNLGLKLVTAGVAGGLRDSKAMDIADSESWRFADHEDGSIFRTGPGDTWSPINPIAGGFMFEPVPPFYGDDELDNDASYPNPWSPAGFSHKDIITPVTQPIEIPLPPSTKTQPASGAERKPRRKPGFFREHIKLSFPRASSPLQHLEALVHASTSVSGAHSAVSSSLTAEECTFGDTTARSTSWSRRGRFGGRLSSRARKNWLLFSPGKLFGAAA